MRAIAVAEAIAHARNDIATATSSTPASHGGPKAALNAFTGEALVPRSRPSAWNAVNWTVTAPT